MNQTGIRGGLYAVSEWIMKFSLANLQWVVFNLPVALLLISLFYVEKSESLIYLFVPLFLLAPFVFFPATTALFAKAREWVRTDHDDSPDRTFHSYYKENYKKSLQGGWIFISLWAILAADIYYFSMNHEWLMNLFFIMGILLFVFTVNFFSVMVHYEMKLSEVIRQSFLVTLGSPLLFLTIVISTGILLYISLYIFQLMILIFTGSIIAFLSFSAFYRLYLKVEKRG